jgi:hypothetical protein
LSGSQGVPAWAPSRFQWLCSDFDGDSLSYDVFMANSLDVTAVEKVKAADPSVRIAAGIATPNLLLPSSSLDYNTTYVWAVRACDSWVPSACSLTPLNLWTLTTVPIPVPMLQSVLPSTQTNSRLSLFLFVSVDLLILLPFLLRLDSSTVVSSHWYFRLSRVAVHG